MSKIVSTTVSSNTSVILQAVNSDEVVSFKVVSQEYQGMNELTLSHEDSTSYSLRIPNSTQEVFEFTNSFTIEGRSNLTIIYDESLITV